MDIQQLRELEKAATPGPWNTDTCRYHADDRKLIAALRNAAPHLFAVVEAAEKIQKYLDTPLSLQPAGARLAAHEALDTALADFRNAK